MTKLQILICTWRQRITVVERVLLPAHPDVSYLVSWQEPVADMEVPEALRRRTDVTVVTTNAHGLSRNRNNAIAHATGEVCLIADDDITYTGAEPLLALWQHFCDDPQLAIAAFRTGYGGERRAYPATVHDLRHKCKGYYPISIELAFRLSAVRGRLRFDERFGLGAERLDAGEEAIFVHDAVQAGLKALFFPTTIVHHPHPTTGIRRRASKRVLMANAAVLWTCQRDDKLWPRAVLMALRAWQATGLSPFTALQWIREGIRYARSIRGGHPTKQDSETNT